MRAKTILNAALTAAGLALAGAAAAQSYPARPIVVYDNIPGGPQEAAKRAILDKMKSNTGATIVYEPRPGGGGAPGLQALKAAAPDGYVFGMTYQSALTLNPLMNPELGIDPIRDYTPISNMWSAGNVWTARIDHPAKDLRDLVAMAKAKPESVKVGVFGAGNRFFIAQLEEKTGAKFLQVPYKTLGEAMAAVLGGQIDTSFDGASSVLGKKDTVKILLYGIEPRLAAFPDVPTTKEMYGLTSGSWVGIFGPAKLPEAQVAWFSREFIRALKDTAIAKMVGEQIYTLTANTPAEFAAQLRAEVEEHRALVKKYPNIR
jgi:tripartite-type tricarboxylate transporter receptor subunit TctC